MSAESTLYDTLKADAGVLAIVGPTADVARIYPDVIPQDADVPAIAFVRVDTEYVSTVHAAAPLGSSATLEVSCVELTREKADVLALAVIAAAGPVGFLVLGRSAVNDPDTGLWASVLNLLFNE